ncbi:MAG: C40 family peptidase [Rhizobiaceae bacterium]|nr:C40 family peptidase [Rhizobiaceae bacterium]
MSGLDKRLNAFRPSLADARLKGKVEAAEFREGREAMVFTPVANVHSAPSDEAGVDTQLLRGERVFYFDNDGQWCWVQSQRDGYVGYVPSDQLAKPGPAATHRICAPTTFVYPTDDLKAPRKTALSLGTEVAVTGTSERRGTTYAQLATLGFSVMQHLWPLERWADDYVSIAESLEHTPYLWGGASGFGIDCSGLVQLSLRMAGRQVLRDTDMQQQSIGDEINPATGLRRGDLVFWKGHVAIMLDGENIIHANGHTMTVAREPLAAAVERIAYLYSKPVAYRRL